MHRLCFVQNNYDSFSIKQKIGGKFQFPFSISDETDEIVELRSPHKALKRVFSLNLEKGLNSASCDELKQKKREYVNVIHINTKKKQFEDQPMSSSPDIGPANYTCGEVKHVSG